MSKQGVGIGLVVAIAIIGAVVYFAGHANTGTKSKEVTTAPQTTASSPVPASGAKAISTDAAGRQLISGLIASASASKITVKSGDESLGCTLGSTTNYRTVFTNPSIVKKGDVMVVVLDPKTSKPLSALTVRGVTLASFLKSSAPKPGNVSIGEVISADNGAVKIQDRAGVTKSYDISALPSGITLWTLGDASQNMGQGEKADLLCGTDGTALAVVVYR
ncbi:MAG TPA: hypothetical protein VFT82_01855 [Candidatus Paceibacterota bacterium]|nr:hypothetical protein [Candidatus Paceibacterota bacterium]